MKLPKCQAPTGQRARPLIAATILLVGCLQQARANHPHQEPAAANEISTSTKLAHQATDVRANYSQFSRDVANLRLWPDLRSIKLRWTYEHGEVNRPESFKIRYCELTSWITEIKCRHKEMAVRGELAAATKRDLQKAALREPTGANDPNSPVITMASAVHSAGPQLYETQIYDLRALTNYTFHVQVARFANEQQQQQQQQQPQQYSQNSLEQQQLKQQHVATLNASRQRPSRRLDVMRDSSAPANLVSADSVKLAQIETTKPFSAEAVKCLAGSSEVLINTGRYFGGRISVENQPEARCQLLGNKSSEQSVYSFNIDHAACHSKVIDGNRIETMILVHENKDILTHNTARFLVQCNIGQESFTVKASISLPKVINSLASGSSGSDSHTRSAIITPLGSRPGARFPPASSPDDPTSGFDRVHLGSMPGVYRLIRAETGQPAGAAQALTSSSWPSAATSNYLDGAQTTGGAQQTSSPATIASSAPATSAGSSQLAAGELARTAPAVGRSQRHSKGLSAEGESSLPLPKPVDVSSRILFVERASSQVSAAAAVAQREPRLMLSAHHHQQPATSVNQAASLHKQQSGEHSSGERAAGNEAQNSNRVTLLRAASGQVQPLPQLQQLDEDTAEATIMTNNHRVAGDFITLDQHRAGERKRASGGQQAGEDFSIKYSTSKVDEYLLNKLPTLEDSSQPLAAGPASQMARSRSGRMRQIGPSTSSSIESRMGDVALATTSRSSIPFDSLVAESSNQSEQTSGPLDSISGNLSTSSNPTSGSTPPTTTLAHNITGALIRWSLKTLGNIARKSLESLVVDENQDQLSEGREGEQIDAIRLTTQPGFAAKSTLSPLQASPATRQVDVTLKPTLSQQAADSNPSPLPARIDGFDVSPKVAEMAASNLAIGIPSQKSTLRPQSGAKVLASQAQRAADVSSEQMRRARHQQGEQSEPTQRWRQIHHSAQKQKPSTTTTTTTTTTTSAPNDEKVRSSEIKETEGQVGAASDRYSKESSRWLWPLYSFWAICGLICFIMVAIYFVLMSPARRAPLSSHSTALAARQQNTSASWKPTSSGNLMARLNEAFREPGQLSSIGHQVGACKSVVTLGDVQVAGSRRPDNNNNRNKLAAGFQALQSGVQEARGVSSSSSSSPTGSSATRSTSAASSGLSSPSGAGQNYCKDQEQYVVYTDYLVLTDDNCSLADDHECLTRSAGRPTRRPGSESFA